MANNNDNPFWFDVDSGTSNAATVIGYSGSNYTDAIQLAPSEWHHLAATVDATNAKFYANGVLIGTVSALSGWVWSGLQLTNSGGSTAWNANAATKHYFDEATLFDEVLSGDQIAALYNGGNGRFVKRTVQLMAAKAFRVKRATVSSSLDSIAAVAFYFNHANCPRLRQARSVSLNTGTDSPFRFTSSR